MLFSTTKRDKTAVCVCECVYSLLQQGVLELFGVELHPQLVCTHPSSGEEHRMFDEVRGRRAPGGVRVDHQLKHKKMMSTRQNRSWVCLKTKISCVIVVTLSRLMNSGLSTWGMEGSLPWRISCHLSPLVGRGSAPEALTTVRARAKMSALVRLV